MLVLKGVGGRPGPARPEPPPRRRWGKEINPRPSFVFDRDRLGVGELGSGSLGSRTSPGLTARRSPSISTLTALRALNLVESFPTPFNRLGVTSLDEDSGAGSADSFG
jgi:hypothetical protein